jgi:peroxiredoxin
MGHVAPGRAAGLVLVDIVPRMEQVGTDRIKDFMVERMSEGFASLDEVADAVAAYNPNRKRPSDTEGLRKNMRERDGRFYWHWDPAFIQSQPDRGPAELADHDLMMGYALAVDEPILLVRGRMSDVVSEAGAQEFLDAVPGSTFVDVGDAGHMVAGDRNDAFTDAVVGFLDMLH